MALSCKPIVLLTVCREAVFEVQVRSISKATICDKEPFSVKQSVPCHKIVAFRALFTNALLSHKHKIIPPPL